jgi:hypothetical protein
MGLLEGCDSFRVSLYAVDVAVFIKPNEVELQVTTEILNSFAQASGLHTNIYKTKCYPIQCDGLDLSFLSSANLVIS